MNTSRYQSCHIINDWEPNIQCSPRKVTLVTEDAVKPVPQIIDLKDPLLACLVIFGILKGAGTNSS